MLMGSLLMKFVCGTAVDSSRRRIAAIAGVFQRNTGTMAPDEAGLADETQQGRPAGAAEPLGQRPFCKGASCVGQLADQSASAARQVPESSG